jgi:hypothetical protein
MFLNRSRVNHFSAVIIALKGFNRYLIRSDQSAMKRKNRDRQKHVPITF